MKFNSFAQLTDLAQQLDVAPNDHIGNEENEKGALVPTTTPDNINGITYEHTDYNHIYTPFDEKNERYD